MLCPSPLLPTAPDPFSPPGFSFPFFGSSANSFEVSLYGHIRLKPTGIQSSGSNSYAEDSIVAPYWAGMQLGASGQILWQFQSGVLVVEWQSLEHAGTAGVPPVCTFQIRMDTASGVIEFCYASPAPALVPNNGVGTVGMTGPQLAGSAMPVVLGFRAGQVYNRGQLVVWPSDAFIRFTPTSGSFPSISASLNHSQFPSPSAGDEVPFVSGTSLASTSLQFSVDDPDGDPIALDATLSDGGSTNHNFVEPEFERASNPGPYAILPISGSFSVGVVCRVMLIATDGANQSMFYFTLKGVAPPTPPPSLEDSAKKFKISHCTVNEGASLAALSPLLALLVVAGLMRVATSASAGRE